MERILVQPSDTELTNIYSMEELEAMTPSPEQCEDFYNNNDLYISMVVAMWKFTGKSDDTEWIIRECQTNPRFMYENTWTKEQRSEFEHRFHKILMKCLDIDSDEAYENLQQWSAFGNAFNLDDYSEENFNAYLELMKDISGDDNSDDDDE